MDSLEDICKRNELYFQIILQENSYCNLSFARKIECPYLGEKDKNDLYPCTLRKGEYLPEDLN